MMKPTRFYKRFMTVFIVSSIGGLLYALWLHHLGGGLLEVEWKTSADKHGRPALVKVKAYWDLSIDTCQSPVMNVSYLKVHKTGSSTIAKVFNRYGYMKNLSFLLPKDTLCGRGHVWEMNSVIEVRRNLLGYSHKLGVASDTRYNLFTLHTTYNRPVLEELMLPGSLYVTSLRDPVGQFESAFVFYKFSLALPYRLQHHPNVTEQLGEWFKDPRYYTSQYKNIVKSGGVQKSREAHLFSRNSQMRDLGFNMDLQENQLKVAEYIAQLDREIDFIFIMEYFDESLLLMKKQFCWAIDDILYIPENQRPQALRRSQPLPEDTMNAIRGWNSADHQLYVHFNRTLWRKVQEYGPHFESDLRKFRRLLKIVFKACIRKGVDRKSYALVEYIKRRRSPGYCGLLTLTKNGLMDKIRRKQAAQL